MCDGYRVTPKNAQRPRSKEQTEKLAVFVGFRLLLGKDSAAQNDDYRAVAGVSRPRACLNETHASDVATKPTIPHHKQNCYKQRAIHRQ